jgi:hypothetical protein
MGNQRHLGSLCYNRHAKQRGKGMAEKTGKRKSDDRGKKDEAEYWIPRTVEELKERCPEHFDRLMATLKTEGEEAFVEEFE